MMIAKIARLVVAVVVAAAGCSTDGGSEALSDYWLAFDPCGLGDTAAAASLMGVKTVTTEVLETTGLLGDPDVITGKTCTFDVQYGSRVAIWFGQGSSSLDRGGRLTDLPGIGDAAGMTVNDGEYDADRDGEILGIVINVEGMSVIVSPPSSDTPRENTPEAEQLIEIARVAADRMRIAAQNQ